MKQAVVCYDLSRSAGWAVWAPKLHAPRFGILQLPPPLSNGSVGPALALLFEHISWVDRNYGPLAHLGHEMFLAPTGGKKDAKTSFITSPKTVKALVGFSGVAELAAHLLDIESHQIHNMSWRRSWVGAQPRGTGRDEWKRLSVAKAMRCGWAPQGDDDADALGQLHFLLAKLKIVPQWQKAIDMADVRLPL
ncbi:MAG: hypothetical protein V4696_03590 [Pseudomonadota bacterium]